MELGVMEDMGRRWLVVEERLLNDIKALEAEALQVAAEGEAISQQLAWRMDSFKRLKARLDEELAKYNKDFATALISEKQSVFGMYGVQSSAAAINASFTTGFAPWFPVMNKSAVEAMAGMLSNGAPLLSLLKEDYPESVAGITNALVNGIARGHGVGTVAQEMARGMDQGLGRAILIARSEVNRAYRTAAVQQYRESKVVNGFRRLVKKATACAACLMLDGEEFETKDYLYDHPAGKCVAVPNVIGVKPAQWETGREYFEKLSPEEQMARMGREKYEAWQDGKFELGDLAKVSESDTWGKSPRVASLKELVGG